MKDLEFPLFKTRVEDSPKFDLTDPKAPTLLPLANGDITNDITPDFSWTPHVDDDDIGSFDLQVSDNLAFNGYVLDVSIITGRTDIISKIQLHSIEALDSFILDEIRQIDGIINSETMIALENVTSKSNLPKSLFME